MGSGGPDDNDGQAGRLAYIPALTSAGNRQDDQQSQQLVAHSLTSEGHDASEDGTGRGAPLTTDGAAVRRLTTTECCRLQSFPDDWCGEPNNPPDSPRYAAMGDAVTVNVAEWIGHTLMETPAVTV